MTDKSQAAQQTLSDLDSWIKDQIKECERRNWTRQKYTYERVLVRLREQWTKNSG